MAIGLVEYHLNYISKTINTVVNFMEVLLSLFFGILLFQTHPRVCSFAVVFPLQVLVFSFEILKKIKNSFAIFLLNESYNLTHYGLAFGINYNREQ